MSSFAHLSADELIEAGAVRENRLSQIEAERKTLAPTVEAEGRKLRTVAGKLVLSGGGAWAAFMAAPVTGGWSLVAVVFPLGYAAWELSDFAADVGELYPQRQHLAHLRSEAAKIADELEEIKREIDSRP